MFRIFSSDKVLPAPVVWQTDEPEGDGPVFGMLEGGGGRMGSVFLFVISF